MFPPFRPRKSDRQGHSSFTDAQHLFWRTCEECGAEFTTALLNAFERKSPFVDRFLFVSRRWGESTFLLGLSPEALAIWFEQTLLKLQLDRWLDPEDVEELGKILSECVSVSTRGYVHVLQQRLTLRCPPPSGPNNSTFVRPFASAKCAGFEFAAMH